MQISIKKYINNLKNEYEIIHELFSEGKHLEETCTHLHNNWRMYVKGIPIGISPAGNLQTNNSHCESRCAQQWDVYCVMKEQNDFFLILLDCLVKNTDNTFHQCTNK